MRAGKLREHQAFITRQIEETKHRQQNVEMDDRERHMNSQLLTKIAQDETLLAKIEQRLNATTAVRANSMNSIPC